MSDHKAGVDRRKILMGGASVAGLGLLSAGGSFYYNTSARLIEKSVRSLLPGLEISSEEMAEFIADFMSADADTSSAEWFALRLVGPYTNMPPFRWMTPRFVSKRFQNYERRVLNEFMMATDFFDTYAKGTKKVSYLGLYSPNEMPCVDPLPRFPDDDEVVSQL